MQDKGGTWSGAIEALKKKWVPVWAKRQETQRSGNADLVDRGARWLPAGELSLSALMAERAPEPPEVAPDATRSDEQGRHEFFPQVSEPPPSYEVFLDRLESLTAESPVTPVELLNHLTVTKTQLNAWLKHAVAERRAKKFEKPVRYQSTASYSGQRRML